MTGAEDKIGYRFKDRSLLQQALTHPSYGGDHRVPHYQRLEFLGDAVLELYISEMLYKAYPDMPEGKLTRMRADLVKEETLSGAVKDMGIPPYIRLSAGEDKSGGRDKSSILCDIFEAVAGAIYLDGGRREAGEFIRRALGERLNRDTSRDDHLDSKSRLQALLQAVGDMPEGKLTRMRADEQGLKARALAHAYRVGDDGDLHIVGYAFQRLFGEVCVHHAGGRSVYVFRSGFYNAVSHMLRGGHVVNCQEHFAFPGVQGQVHAFVFGGVNRAGQVETEI